MNNLRLPSQDSATGRGIKTALQTVIGFTVTFFTGLILAVWQVDGVPQVVLNYVQHNFIQVLLSIGIPAGVAGFVWNYFRKNVPNY